VGSFLQKNPEMTGSNGDEKVSENCISRSASCSATKTKIEQADTLNSQNELKQAFEIYKDILEENPEDADALFGVGVILKKQKKLDLAIQFLSKAIQSNPNKIEALLARGRIFRLQDMFENALSDFTEIISSHQNIFEALIARGITYGQTNQFNLAINDFDMAIKINRNSAEAFYNRGVALESLHKFEAAIGDYSIAIKLNPHDYKAYNNRGVARRETECPAASLKDFEKSVEINPDFAEGYYNKSLNLLSDGNLKEGFKLYECRWSTAHFQSQVRHFPQPLWLGREDLVGKTILLHSEQGLGDSIQFCRYIKFFKNMQCRVLLEIEKPLMAIMQCLLPQEQIFEKNSLLPDFDVHCPLMSLPLAFKTTLDNIPSPNAYLKAPLLQKEHWENYLGIKTKPRVGVVWQGHPGHPRDCYRSLPLGDLMSELTADIDWISLQFEISQMEKQLITKASNIRHFGTELGNFDKSSGLVENLDAVLSVDTSMAHLAAALGKPVYLLTGNVADFRWFRDMQSSPWYPTLKIYKRAKHQTWQNLIATTISKLRSNIKQRPNYSQKVRTAPDVEKI